MTRIKYVPVEDMPLVHVRVLSAAEAAGEEDRAAPRAPTTGRTPPAGVRCEVHAAELENACAAILSALDAGAALCEQASATCCEPAEAADEAGATAGGVVAISVVPRGRLVKLKDERPRTLRSSTSRVRKPLRTRANAPAVARAAPALKKGSNGAERKKPKRVAFQKEE